MTQTWPLARVLRVVRPGNGQSWKQVVESFERSPYDAATVSLLRDARRRAALRPIAVSRRSWHRRYELLDGRHRVVASLLDGAPDIPVRFGRQDPGPQEQLEVSISLSPPLDVEDAFGLLRSFPSPRGWVETGYLAGVGTSWSTTYAWPAADVDGLVKVLSTRGAGFGIGLRVDMVVQVDDDLQPLRVLLG